uniref:Mariner transposase [Bombyx mori] n=1 Tax=Lepeophtheirus salmonis TaxID=72036 RepID=A0A0K2U786_LEPSM
MQDRSVTYREIEASLGISSTSIHSILHVHLAVKKVCSRWMSQNLTIAQKKARIDWCKEMLKKYTRGASKDVYKIVTDDESWIYAYEPETKQQSSVFEDLRKKMRAQRFLSPEDAVEAFKNHVLDVSQSEWKKSFDNWFERMQKCKKHAG